MKKNYESPKVEKLEFNYADTVVASGPPDVPTDKGCHLEEIWSGDNTTGTKCHCSKKWKWVANC